MTRKPQHKVKRMFLTGSLLLLIMSSWQAVGQIAPETRFSAERTVLAEGDVDLRVTISRAVATHPAIYNVQVSGDAVAGSDFQIGTDGQLVNGILELTMMPGQLETYFVLQAVDDVAAEANETVILTLLELAESPSGSRATLKITMPANDFVVTSVADAGEGSIRQAILNANASPGPDRITFDADVGPFGPPQVIRLEQPLPVLSDEVEVDGYVKGFLWQPAGVTLDGAKQVRVFEIADGVKATLRNLTLANGFEVDGGAVLNKGELVITGVTFIDNKASSSGGAVVNEGNSLVVINSTFAANFAQSGGAIRSSRGSLRITNSTFDRNNAENGGALHNLSELRLDNSVMANGESGPDCVSTSGTGTHNIIERNDGCPGVLFEANPNFERMAYFNGMTQTIALGMKSLAINTGSNEAAVDENGEALTWDQRGNGDPRIVAGFVDIGAFETQAFPKLIVDTLEDVPQRGCGGVRGDCPLRSALLLVEVSDRFDTITFDPKVFAEPQTLVIDHPLPAPTRDIIIDGSEVGELTISPGGADSVFTSGTPATIEFRNVVLEEPR